MESSSATPRDALAAAERATAAMWTDYPPTPAWYYPAAAAWAAALVYTATGIDALPARALTTAALLAAGALFSLWYRSYRGAMPRLGSAPPEFRRPMVAFTVVEALLVVGVAVVGLVLDQPVAAAAATFVVAVVGLYLYERAYESAVRRTRQRLG